MTSQPQTDQQQATPPVIDYEGSQYETDFWIGRGRDYEDAVERIALRSLIPAKGGRIAEVGAAFGRLVELYQGYEQIILLDYSRSQLQTAAKRLGNDPRYVFVAGNVYSLPLADGVLDTLVMVRVMHHLADVSHALSELKRVTHSKSTTIVEYANKRNLKALFRWWGGKQDWSPHHLDPVEFVKLNFDFHPDWMTKRFEEAGFSIHDRLAVSHFRLGLLKRLVPTNMLAGIDSLLFRAGNRYPVSPSVFVRMNSQNSKNATNVSTVSNISTQPIDITSLFRCPKCGGVNLKSIQEDILLCPGCDSRYAKKLGVWDFKDPVDS